MLEEKWVEINGYKISNFGRVINKKGYELSRKPQRDGYISTAINLGHPYGKVCGMHRIVATAFIPNPENKPEVNHIDGDKTNNRVDNLEWVTKKENQIHASYSLNKRVGIYNYNSKINDDIVIKIYEMCRDTNLKYKEIAKIFNVSEDTPSKIACGRRWSYLGLKPLINRKNKPVIGTNVKTKETIRYESARAARIDGFSHYSIRDCCIGKMQEHKGYTWEFES